MAGKKRVAAPDDAPIPESVLCALEQLAQGNMPDDQDTQALVSWFRVNVQGIPQHVCDADRLPCEFVDIANRLRRRGYGPEVV